MAVGEKLKAARIAANMTQKELAGDGITRNMLSQIERGIAEPSLPTLRYLAERLELSPGYFLSDLSSPLGWELREKLPALRKAYENGDYAGCARDCERFRPCGDAEIALLLAESHFRLGQTLFEQGDFAAAAGHFRAALREEGSTYTAACMEQAAFYLQLTERADDPPMPPEELRESKKFSDLVSYIHLLRMIADGMTDLAAAIYDTARIESAFLRRHINARLSMAGYNYSRAKELLTEILNEQEEGKEPPFAEIILRDLEFCCKATGDYEGAYLCAAKRLARTKPNE